MTLTRTSYSKTAIYNGPGTKLEERYIELPTSLKAAELLVRVNCCTLCGSDISTILGKRIENFPSVLGHEIVGEVVAIGPGLRFDLREKVIELGDRIVWSVAASCFSCTFCLRDMPQKCIKLKKYGHTSIDEQWKLSGGLAEYCHLIEGTGVVVVENSLPDEVCAIASCAMATACQAIDKIRHLRGSRVLIFGAGLLGLLAASLLSQQQTTSIVVCDFNAARLAKAKKFGATQCINLSYSFENDQVDLQDRILSESPDSFDVILEMSGSHQAVSTSLQLANIGAQIMLIGSVHPMETVSMCPETVVRKMLNITGIHNYRPIDLLQAVQFFEKHIDRFPFDQLIERTFGLSEINEAVAFVDRCRPIRVAIKPES